MVMRRELKRNGYFIDQKVTQGELERLRKFVSDHYHQVIREICTEEIDARSAIENYHKMDFAVKHEKLWPKANRILGEEFEAWFLNSNLRKRLENEFGTFTTSDEENKGRGNYYWRLTRPGHAEDIGPLHRDSWFWELNNNFNHCLKGLKRVKVWIPLHVEKGLNGLLVEPRSHLRQDIRWSSKYKDKIMKPVLDNVNKTECILLDTEPGQCVIFDDELLHGGALNNGSKTRISMEFTMLIKESNYNE